MEPISHPVPDAQRVIPIFIDDVKFELHTNPVTGAQLRALVPVPADRDLWLDIPGPRDDDLIRPELQYEFTPGAHFYTAPSTINPGGY
ncbi:hypothetical protein BL243_23095 [Ralstonia solanacearum]|nr:hypothetical protein BL243_23095 [Ralstonia solanacearum]